MRELRAKVPSQSRRSICLGLGLLLVAASVSAQPPERLNLGALGRLPAFSHATQLGEVIFVSGTLGTQEGSLDLAPGGMSAQTTQTLRNIERILVAAGSDLEHVAKCNVYVTDMAQFDAMNRAYIAVFGNSPPARTTVGVAELALGASVEIECIAKKASTNMALDLKQTTGVLERDGEAIYYEMTGDGEPLVLSHGLGGNHAIWYQQVPVLAQHYRVITWDQRGFGRSSNKNGKADPAVYAEDLAALLDHLKIDSAHLVGQSMGGWTVTLFALDHPERVRSLVLADTVGGILTEAGQKLLFGGGAPSTVDPATLPIVQHPAIGKALGAADPAQAFLYRQIGSVAEPPPANVVPALFSTNVAQRAHEIEAPVLLIVGSEDDIFPPALIRLVANELQDSRVVEISGAGHSPYFEQPAVWNRAVSEFLSELGRP
jgi:reactive intermediate/imine deaminase